MLQSSKSTCDKCRTCFSVYLKLGGRYFMWVWYKLYCQSNHAPCLMKLDYVVQVRRNAKILTNSSTFRFCHRPTLLKNILFKTNKKLWIIILTRRFQLCALSVTWNVHVNRWNIVIIKQINWSGHFSIFIKFTIITLQSPLQVIPSGTSTCTRK